MERPILFSGEMVRAILEGRKTQTRRVVRVGMHEEDPCDPSEWKCPRFPKGRHCFRLPGGSHVAKLCPLGVPGDHLWVRETWTLIPNDMRGRDLRVAYRAGGEGEVHMGEDVYGAPGSTLIHMTIGCALADYDNGKWGVWRPSIHMPRIASRLKLEILSVKVERLQDISESDAEAEGVGQRARLPGLKPNEGPCSECGRPYHAHPGGSCYRTHYHNLTFRGAYAHLWESIYGPGSWKQNPLVWAIVFAPVTNSARVEPLPTTGEAPIQTGENAQ